ncbi:calcium-binding protein [Oleomonas cavernae]|uniref:Calcium-binding protein n=2 Tax=Oleomonas cavernae TaxID=2320859 RepID=A0A418WCX6_9PROT|nr:calcium-binding protein [Oleomonas cavernae]
MGADTLNGDAGDDALFGQGGADIINGGDGNDLIDGGSGIDAVNGGADNDTLYGGEGTEETVHGDAGDDILHSGGEGHYYGDAGDDLVYAGLTAGVNEFLDGGTGSDTVNTTTWNGTYVVDLAAGTTNFDESFTNFENVVTGNGADTITGTDGDNVIRTQGGIDSVNAGDGDDTVAGGGAGDTLNGGNGIDTLDYATSTGAVTILLASNSASGGDAAGDIISSFENVIGSVLSDVLTGDSNANVLAGGAGGDTLDGADGIDTLDYSRSSTGVTVDLAAGTAAGGEATGDAISNFENLIGSNAGDTLTGDSNANNLAGGDGNDALDGGAGADTLVGGGGDDTYIVNHIGDTVTESAGQGIDEVRSNLAFTLGANLENLILTGASVIKGTGNAADNEITGNGAANTLTGESGDDTLDGNGGNDTLVGGLGNDTYYIDLGDNMTEKSGEGADTVMSRLDSFTLANNFENLTYAGAGDFTGTGNSAANVVRGDDGNDTLSGGRGADTLIGGLGDDTYTVDNPGDVVDETGGGGIDTVRTSASHTLEAGIENLVQLGSVTTTGTGNGLANTMTGNNIANRLNGMGGDDTIIGGNGADTLKGGDDNDTVTGGGDNDLLMGEAGNDVIDGGTGDDDMRGGTGDDTYVVNSVTDVVSEAGGGGMDTVQSIVAWTLASGIENLVITTSQSVAGTGNAGDNTITGGAGANTLSGLGGVDVINGSGGADTINGGAGADMLTGGTGNDLFIFAAGQANGDTVLDFDGNGASTGDRLRFTGFGTEAAGATFIQLDATNWQVTSANGAITEVITFANAAPVHTEDYVFV